MTNRSKETGETAPFEPVSLLLQQPMMIDGKLTCREAVRLFANSPDALDGYACVNYPDGRYAGLLSLQRCVASNPDFPVIGVATVDHPIGRPDWTAEETAGKIHDDDLKALPVVDNEGTLLGLVPAITAHRFLFDKFKAESDTFSGLVGQSDDHYLDLSIWMDFQRRLPWIMGLAVAGLAAGYVVHLYENALDALVILALYMPMVADTGGNVGTQSASLVTRAISSGGLQVSDTARVLWKETRVSLLMAAFLFLFAFLKVLLISNAQDVPEGLTLQGIGLAIATALAVQVVSATLIGAVLPVVSLAARQDPAVVSGPALTTIVDVTGLLIYFSITTQFLGLRLVE
ncbi:hypothetical protein Q669_01345 [Labrenzia sp. C1B10]|uniref:magnesium transporter n=1 Tax=unclassified Labrenzia TaxID=2648686 RepID=UPI0003B7E4E5|nr:MULTISPECIES: magnesium transporter [unclassified Labrenzia]ERP96022.1 hypothetical protein Q669_01345 [Labrenzia sp. C1B10]ERS02308.1 hypothetical protein Q675_32320 [Labrenzia sp. C1B70]